jgi:1-acyl-sn-glycerol-3-phosphate acyltransferase
MGSGVEIGSLEIPQGAAGEALRQANPLYSLTRVCAFVFGYIIFASLGILSSALCLLPALVLNNGRARQVGQHLIRWLFRFYLWYLDFCGLVAVEAPEIALLRNTSGSILVANHPSLLDAVILAALVPNVCCIMKSKLGANPILCGQSKLAGYVHNKSGSGLIKTCASRIREGSNMLIFPEGTRSKGQLGSCKRGFALLSQITGRPIQTILITASCPFLGKEWPLFKMPPFPVRFQLQLGDKFSIRAGEDVKAFGRRVEDYLRIHAPYVDSGARG